MLLALWKKCRFALYILCTIAASLLPFIFRSGPQGHTVSGASVSLTEVHADLPPAGDGILPWGDDQDNGQDDNGDDAGGGGDDDGDGAE